MPELVGFAEMYAVVTFSCFFSKKFFTNCDAERRSAMRPTLSAFTEMRAKMVKATGRITADLNLRAKSSGNKSFLNFPRASARIQVNIA